MTDPSKLSGLKILGNAEPDRAEKPRVNLAKLRERLDQAKGPTYWKSLEELAESDDFEKFLEDEFPNRAPDWMEPAQRRTFLKVMGASMALAGLAACTKQPKETIVPYVRQPEEFIPGKPLFYATAMQMSGVATGLLVESHLGRPTKVEGNPDHPGSLGASDYFNQASVLTLYDPDRSQVATNRGRISSWVGFQAALTQERERANLNKGAGFRILTETVTSPTLGNQIKDFQKQLPAAKWHQWEPMFGHSAAAGAQMAFGRPVNTIYHFDKADVIVSLDADFLSCGPGNLRYAREFADRRRVLTNITKTDIPKEDRQEGFQPGPDAPYRNQAATHVEEDKSPGQQATPAQAQGLPIDQTNLSRMYMVESAPSPTGGMADHRWALKPSEIENVAWQLAAALGVGGASSTGTTFKAVPAMAKDLQAHRGRSLVIAGQFQPAGVHALAHAMNQALGNAGQTVTYTEPIEANPVDQLQSLRELIGDLNAGKVDTLVILGGNPVYNTPAHLGFADALKKAKLRLHLSLYDNETSAMCEWHLPEAHYLESWGDTRAYDGTVTFVQPLIAPLYGGKTATEVMTVLGGQSEQSAHETVRQNWQGTRTDADFDVFWQTALHDGVVPNTAAAPINVSAKAPAAGTNQAGAQGLEISFRPDPTIWDGTFSNNSWLQECPKPETKMVWDNAVWISPVTAQRLGISTNDVVEVKYQGRTVTGGAWILPGQAPESVTVHFGYGRTRGGKVCQDIGFNAYALQTADQPGRGSGVEIRKTGAKYLFAATQHTQTMEEREPVRMATLDEYKKNPGFANEEDKPIPKYMSLYPDYRYEGYKWGMAIDQNACVGCSACVVACQAENNIAVVGKDQVSQGRHMHWIRVDRYFKGNMDDPELYFQPVPCMHCENAPCELVCPVAATVHSGEGLNQMIYNRCVGTRYCSNNCPYKVRRFNYFRYSDWDTQSLYPMRNPDVTVRSRGVMEKCTYCIQRINGVKIEAEKENRRVRDGEIVPACAQACPTQAIVFGDINDPKSKVAQLKVQMRNYSLLEELNARPRTTYLARLRNPNPEIERG
jgi:molybdopterin-containing oxidoreductase family iron-sulfur binding subunit